MLLKAAKQNPSSRVVSGAALAELANVAEVADPAADPLLALPALASTDAAHPPIPPPSRRGWWTWLAGRVTAAIELTVISVYQVMYY